MLSGSPPGVESRGEEWGSQVGKGPSVPASPPRTPHPHGGKHPGFPAPKTAVTVCVEGAAAGTREQVLRHCCSPGLRAKWTQNSRAGCQGPAAHMDAATQSSTEARVTGATSTAGAHCRHGSLSGFQLEGAEWSAQHPRHSGVGSSAHPAPVPAAVPP